MNEIGSEVVKERYIRGFPAEWGRECIIQYMPNRCPYVYSYQAYRICRIFLKLPRRLENLTETKVISFALYVVAPILHFYLVLYKP